MNELWFEAYPHRWFWHYDLPLIYTQFCSSCHRLIHTERTSHEREAGFHYNRNDSQISELESWMNYDLKLTHTGGSDTAIYHSFTRNFAMLVTPWSIRSELNMNEKQGPTTTEMTAKSVNWSLEWFFWFEAYAHRWFCHYDLPLISTQLCHACHRLIHTERTSHEREAGTHYNRNDSQISELESWMNSWFEAYAHRWFCHYDLPLIYTQFCHACHRLIHTERTSHEREAGTHYNRSYSGISEWEYWMMIWRWYNWCCWHYAL